MKMPRPLREVRWLSNKQGTFPWNLPPQQACRQRSERRQHGKVRLYKQNKTKMVTISIVGQALANLRTHDNDKAIKKAYEKAQSREIKKSFSIRTSLLKV